MKRTMLAASAAALLMAGSSSVIANGFGFDDCKVPRGAINAIEKGDYDQARNVICSSNTNQGNGNGTELVLMTFPYSWYVENGAAPVYCGVATGLYGVDTDGSLGDGKDWNCYFDYYGSHCVCSDPGNSAD